MSDGGAGSGLPETVGPGLAPGSLVAVLVVDGVVADYVPFTEELTQVSAKPRSSSVEAVGPRDRERGAAAVSERVVEITDEMVEAARRVLLNISIPAETSVRNALTAALKVDREARARSVCPAAPR